jgi:N-methylhydantoinase B/oxoprolinase/acetone carboxylase alpha subunit
MVVHTTDDMVYKQHALDGFLDISNDITKQLIRAKSNTPDATVFDGTTNEMAHSSNDHKGNTDSNMSAAMNSL